MQHTLQTICCVLNMKHMAGCRFCSRLTMLFAKYFFFFNNKAAPILCSLQFGLFFVVLMFRYMNVYKDEL
jgi:hypothetical protein